MYYILLSNCKLNYFVLSDIPQPTYVNMSDLANMAANKAQEMNLPPPPAEFINSNPSSTEKVAFY